MAGVVIAVVIGLVLVWWRRRGVVVGSAADPMRPPRHDLSNRAVYEKSVRPQRHGRR